MPRIPVIKAKDFYQFLIKYGCVAISIRGSHHKIQNPKTSKISVVTIHGGKDFDKGAFSSVLSQLEIDVDEFLKFISNH